MQTQPQAATLYNADFYAWTQQQAGRLRSRNLEHLDIENLAEEIESLGRQERGELEHRLGVLLGHLLKWHYQPQRRSSSWFYTIRIQRRELARLIKRNPSLKPYLDEAITVGYEQGVDIFGTETGLRPDQIPQSCPFSTEQIFEELLDFPEPPTQRATHN